jgi:hypothetical protein
MLGASWVDEHSIAEPVAQHNRPLHALPLAADRSRMKMLCGLQRLRPAQWWRRSQPVDNPLALLAQSALCGG